MDTALRLVWRALPPAQKVMSALAPKADICSALADVRLVPKADIYAEVHSGPPRPRADIQEFGFTLPTPTSPD